VNRRTVCHLILLVLLLGTSAALVSAEAPASKDVSVDQKPFDPAIIDDLVAANHILAAFKVLDAFGHVSIRDPRNPNHYLISRSIAPESVTANDIVVLDLDSNPVDPKDSNIPLYRERFIHGAIYKARPDVNAIVHSHSPTVVPFSVSTVKLRPILHNAGFLGSGPSVFEIRKYEGEATDLEVEKPSIGAALAQDLGKDAVILMRGHGDTVVAGSLPYAIFRAYYTEVNARELAQALALGGPVNYLTPDEARVSDERMMHAADRPWALWKAKMAPK
jgi:ribulose-5-phosphate 4-epimerase/fuculose-1-phosphate aldolase